MKQTAGELAIDLHNVAKTYRRRVHALRGIEMQVHRGKLKREMRSRSAVWIVGTSLGLEFGVLALAAFIFHRRDF
ncbi:MAG: hypothetical protein SVT52_03995 [Planctomycetota bacterium]|nr:hypothetical protein [Planctomycetota bacterium]